MQKKNKQLIISSTHTYSLLTTLRTKKQDILLMLITLRNINRFSKACYTLTAKSWQFTYNSCCNLHSLYSKLISQHTCLNCMQKTLNLTQFINVLQISMILC